jgi:hypothetical protein
VIAVGTSRRNARSVAAVRAEYRSHCKAGLSTRHLTDPTGRQLRDRPPRPPRGAVIDRSDLPAYARKEEPVLARFWLTPTAALKTARATAARQRTPPSPGRCSRAASGSSMRTPAFAPRRETPPTEGATRSARIPCLSGRLLRRSGLRRRGRPAARAKEVGWRTMSSAFPASESGCLSWLLLPGESSSPPCDRSGCRPAVGRMESSWASIP